MTISLKADASGNSGAIQVAGVDRLTLTTDGSLVASANPATGARSMALATMQKFADEFGSSVSNQGYQKLPSGLIVQWGFVNASNISQTQTNAVTFPIAFPTNAPFSIMTNHIGGMSTVTTVVAATPAPTKTGFSWMSSYTGGSMSVFWVAFGN